MELAPKLKVGAAEPKEKAGLLVVADVSDWVVLLEPADCPKENAGLLVETEKALSFLVSAELDACPKEKPVLAAL